MENAQTDPVSEETDAVDAIDAPPTTPVEKQEPPPEKEKKELKPISLNESGLLSPINSTEEWRVAELMLKSRAVPKQFENVPQVIMAAQFLKSHKLNPWISMRQTAIINGTLSLWGELPLGLCKRTGELEECKETLFDNEYNEISPENKNLHRSPWVAVCFVKRKGMAAISRWFTMDQAEKANLLAKQDSIWKKYPERMIQMRARSLALKDSFPDALMGVAIGEYDYESLIEPPKEISSASSIVDEINGVASEGKV